MSVIYEVWWTNKRTQTRKLIGSYADKDNADECCYLMWADEPSPDKADFFACDVVMRPATTRAPGEGA